MIFSITRTPSPQCYGCSPYGRALVVHRAPQLLKMPYLIAPLSLSHPSRL